MNLPEPAPKDKLLFTPGPLTTSLNVKRAMLRDAGSWDAEFGSLVANLRQQLLKLAGVSQEAGWEVVLLQGSGTFGMEAVFQTCVPRTGKVAVLANGAYGNRMVEMLERAAIDYVVLRTAEDTPVPPEALAKLLVLDGAITHVSVVHCETTTGLLNPIRALGNVARSYQKAYIVDAMTSFGAIPLDLEQCAIDFLVSSPNKCLEGVPGFCIVVCRRESLEGCEGRARTLSLDLLAQLQGFDANGQFRFTPPTHSLLALNQALNELEEEGGVSARAARYRRNHQVLLEGMRPLGFWPYLKPEDQSYIITTFQYPRWPGFSFEAFYRKLSQKGFLIYPGKLRHVDTFRIGTIGHLFPGDVEQLLQAIDATLAEMGLASVGGLDAEAAIEPAHG
ncbi:2-aminoethylphosphonate--pyruvate transaminase [Verrucomicrobia bacterium]|nr:2-aminoethylphosphonate--pyruvate transaminase [Verrucomicrobiota bacterium]